MLRPPTESSLFPTRRSSDLYSPHTPRSALSTVRVRPSFTFGQRSGRFLYSDLRVLAFHHLPWQVMKGQNPQIRIRSEEHTSELQSRQYLVCRLLLEKKNHTT